MPDLDPRSPRPVELPNPPARIRAGHTALRVASRLLERHPVLLEYPPPTASPAPGESGVVLSPALRSVLSAGAGRYGETMQTIRDHAEDLRRIPIDRHDGSEPFWNQSFYTGLDAATLYALMRDRRPGRYCEVGSGNSTLFAARAVRDGGLGTRIVCFDPAPRADVSGVCDRLIRQPFSNAAAADIAELRGGDMLLVDSSHVVLQDSDVVALVLGVLPNLPPGVLVGFHDIFLPDDYPWWLAGRGYGEQYLLGAWLLGARPIERLVMACHLCATDPTLRAQLDRMWAQEGLPGYAYGSTLWFES